MTRDASGLGVWSHNSWGSHIPHRQVSNQHMPPAAGPGNITLKESYLIIPKGDDSLWLLDLLSLYLIFMVIFDEKSPNILTYFLLLRSNVKSS